MYYRARTWVSRMYSVYAYKEFLLFSWPMD